MAVPSVAAARRALMLLKLSGVTIVKPVDSEIHRISAVINMVLMSKRVARAMIDLTGGATPTVARTLRPVAAVACAA